MSKEDLIEGKYKVQILMDTAEKVVKKKTEGSKILDVEAENRIPKFKTAGEFGTISYLSYVLKNPHSPFLFFCSNRTCSGPRLGARRYVFGWSIFTISLYRSNVFVQLYFTGFCVVKEITKITLQSGAGEDSHGSDLHLDDEHAIHNFVQDRNFMEAHCLRGKGRDCRYALKKLQDSSRDDAQTFVNGVVDLAVEARFLSIIRHPNIIKMRAMAITSPYSVSEPFFVVLDRLYDIMGTRLAKWKKQKPTGMKKLLDRKGKKELAFWVERITVGYDLACALQHLHELK
jgi:hypothetical protein